MSINISVHGSPVSSRRGNMFITDIENLKTTEINRRRRLRLKQVRQQSKDIANQLRQRVRGELDKQRSLFEQKQTAELKRLQARKLLSLQQQYQDCLDEVGMGHMQAALQPDAAAVIGAEQKRNRARAEDRGKEATVKLRLDLADAEKKRSVPRKQQKFSRTIEDLRSAVITSLGKKSPKRTPKKRHLKKKPPSDVSQVPVPDFPSRSSNCTCGCAVCICTPILISPGREEQIPPIPMQRRSESESESEPEQVREQGEETRISDALLSSDTSDTSSERSYADVSTVQSEATSSTKTSSSTEVEQSRVQFYDHGNRFESDYSYQKRVERIFPHAYEPDATEAAELESQIFPDSRVMSDEDMSSRLRARSRQALVRERLHQDYRQLLGDLHALAREERLIRSTRAHGLPPDVFLEDHRRKELCTKRQKNMDSAFESVYHGVRQDSFSRPSSVAETVSPQDMASQWMATKQDSPARLNVADWQPSSVSEQKITSPINSINVASSSKESVDIQHTTSRTVYSERKISTLQDLVEKIKIQRSLLVDDRKTHAIVPQEPFPTGSLIPKNVGSPDQCPTIRSLNKVVSPSHGDEHEIHAEVLSSEERRDAVDHKKEAKHLEEEVMQSAKEHRTVEKVKDRLEEGKDRAEHILQHNEEEIRKLPVEHRRLKCRKDGNDNSSRESDIIILKSNDKEYRRHRKGNTGRSEKIISEVDKHGRSAEIEVVREDDSVTVLSEYSFDVSVSKTTEHSVESILGNSSSTSYEGVKIVVSVSELTEKKYQSPSSPKRSEGVSRKGSPQKIKKSDMLGRKTCKRKHKLPDRTQRECVIDVSKGSKTVREKATMTTEGPDRRQEEAAKTDVMVGKEETERYKDKDIKLERTKKWHHLINRNLISDTSEASTSYMSPPDQLVTSQVQDLGKLLATVREYEKKRGADANEIDPHLALYISRLLAMSRESVENLGVSTSDISTPDMDTSSAECTNDKVPQRKTKESAKEETKIKEITKDVSRPNVDMNTTDNTNNKVSHRMTKESTKEQTKRKEKTKVVSTPDVDTSAAESTDSKASHIMVKDSTKDKETTKNEMCTNQRFNGDVNVIKEFTNTVREKTKAMTDKLSVNRETLTDTRHAVPGTSGLQVAGPHSYNEFRRRDTQMQSTSTPENIQTSYEMLNRESPDKMGRYEDVMKKSSFLQEQLHGSCRCDDNLCEFDIKTPPFPSIIADMSLDEYKTLKFPEIFSDYSEKCSERISDLAKEIEEIRGEKRKLIESSRSSSSSNSSNEGQGFDLTKYLSPPESSIVMTHLSSKDKGHIAPSQRMESSDQETAVPTFARKVDGTSPQEISQNKESLRGTFLFEPSDGSKTRAEQQYSEGNCHHTRPPPCLWRHKLQSVADTQPIKELSTIIEGDSTQPSCCSQDRKQVRSAGREQSGNTRKLSGSIKSSDESAAWRDEDLPDIMTEMLRRGIITSPLPWTKGVQMSEDQTSISENSVPRSDSTEGSGSSSHSSESRKFTASQRVEHEKFKKVVLESYVGKGIRTPESFRHRQSIANNKMGFSQQVAETFAKLGKNPSGTDVKNALRNLGLKWKACGRDQSVNPVISQEDLDPASEEFRQQVLESFVGLGLDSSPGDLEAAFRRLGLDCPDGLLCRCDIYDSKQAHRSSDTVSNSSDSYNPSSSTSSTVLPTILPSDSDGSDGDLST